MGGKALKNVDLIRLSKDDFYIFQDELIKKLEKLEKLIIPIKAYKNKEDFGDIDILISKPKLEFEELKSFLIQNFNTKEIVKNGDIISFEYKNFQVDLIFEEIENIEIAEFYYSYNDLNNLTGKIAYAFGLKFGFTGLYYPLRTEHGNISKEILLTKQPNIIYEFLGYDFKIYQNGFNSLEDIFNFVVSSPFFSPQIFIKDEKSQIDKVRERKRKTYASFLDWLEIYLKNNTKDFYTFNEDKKQYLNKISDYFPQANLIKEIEHFEIHQRKLKVVSEKFNGKIVMEMIPNLSGKDLGNFIVNFKKHISNKYLKDFETCIFEFSNEKVISEIKDFCEN